jgi:hypothetical protein
VDDDFGLGNGIPFLSSYIACQDHGLPLLLCVVMWLSFGPTFTRNNIH